MEFNVSDPRLALLASLSAPHSDSIYSLAVDSTKYPQEPIVWLLDYGAVKREADGTGSTTFRTVTQVLKQSAVARYQEQSFSYSPGHERFTLNWARVLSAKGEVISEAPTHVQDSDIPAQRGDPVYSDRKVKRVSLTGVAPGTIVDVSYTKEELKPFLKSDFLIPWRLTPGNPVMRSYFQADFPASMKLHVREQNLNFKRTDETQGGRRTITWATRDIPKSTPEAFSPDSLLAGMYIDISGPVEFADVARWYAANARDRYVPTPALRSKVAELVKGASSLDDSIARVHKWVAQDIRYVSIALGLGGYQPRLPDSVMKTGFGDCKDKATLFITAMKLFGVKAYPVILNSFGRVRETVPSISQFDHVIAAYDRKGRRQFVDLTAELYRIGLLPSNYQGAFGLLVQEDGSSEAVRFPAFAPGDNTLRVRVTGNLSEDGKFDGWFEQTGTGSGETVLRGMARLLADSAAKDGFRNFIARRFVRSGQGDSLETFAATDFSARPVIRVRIAKGQSADKSSETMMILPMPFGGDAALSGMVSNLEKLPKRVSPIDVHYLVPPIASVEEFEISLPTGWKAKLPSNVSVDGIAGTYSATYAQEGNILRIRKSRRGTTGVVGPEKMPDVIAWLRSAAKDDARFIVLERES